MLVVQDLLGYRPGLTGFALQPVLPPEVRSLKARVQYCGHAVEVTASGRGSTCRSVLLDGRPYRGSDRRGAWFDAPDRPVKVEILFA